MQHWKDAYGVTPKLLDLFNEPTTGNRELQSSSVQEMVDLVARIGSRLRVAGFADVEFLVPNEETIVRSSQVAQAMLADRASRPYVGAIGYHPYPYGSAYSSPRRILEASGSGTPTIRTAAARAAQGVGPAVWGTRLDDRGLRGAGHE